MRLFFFSSRRRHTRWTGDWSSDVCSSDLLMHLGVAAGPEPVPRPLELAHQLAVVVDLAVLDDDDRAVLVGDRLVAARQVDRSEERRVGKEGRGRWSA